MIFTSLHHATQCKSTKNPTRSTTAGIVVYTCQECGATASTDRRI